MNSQLWQKRSCRLHFQSAFNVVKGSVPARTDVSDSAFDACGKERYERFGKSQFFWKFIWFYGTWTRKSCGSQKCHV